MDDTVEVDLTPRLAEDEAKLAELILHVARRSEDDVPFGKVKLNKLLFFADLAAYRRLGRTITGQRFQKLNEGPAPRRMLPVLNALVARKDITIQVQDYHTYDLEKIVASREPDLALFTDEEITIVNHIVARYWNVSGTEISNLSHLYEGWRLVNFGEDVPFGPGLLGEHSVTEQDVRVARELEPVAEAWLAGESV